MIRQQIYPVYHLVVLPHNNYYYADYLKEAVDDFTSGSLHLWADIQQAHKLNLSENENVVRIVNAKLINIERAFIHDEGLPGRPYFKYNLNF